jgi:hypothetical protein
MPQDTCRKRFLVGLTPTEVQAVHELCRRSVYKSRAICCAVTAQAGRDGSLGVVGLGKDDRIVWPGGRKRAIYQEAYAGARAGGRQEVVSPEAAVPLERFRKAKADYLTVCRASNSPKVRLAAREKMKRSYAAFVKIRGRLVYWSVRMDANELAEAEEIRRRWGFRSLVEVVRFAVRVTAALERKP